MLIIASTRSNLSSSKDDINSTQMITRSTIYKDIFSSKDLEFTCKNCIFDIVFLFFLGKKKARNNKKQHTKQCDQVWNKSYITSKFEATFHRKVCKCLNLLISADADDVYAFLCPRKYKYVPKKIATKETNI